MQVVVHKLLIDCFTKSTLVFLSSWTVFLKSYAHKKYKYFGFICFIYFFFFLGVFDTSYFRFALYLVVSRTNQNKSSTEFETTQLYLLIPCEGGPSYLFQRQLSRETYFLHQQCGIAIPILDEQTPCLGVEKHLQSRSILSKSDFKGGLPLRPGVFIPKLGRMFLERGPSKGDI